MRPGRPAPWGLAERVSLLATLVTCTLPAEATRLWNTWAAPMSNSRPRAHCSSSLHAPGFSLGTGVLTVGPEFRPCTFKKYQPPHVEQPPSSPLQLQPTGSRFQSGL